MMMSSVSFNLDRFIINMDDTLFYIDGEVFNVSDISNHKANIPKQIPDDDCLRKKTEIEDKNIEKIFEFFDRSYSVKKTVDYAFAIMDKNEDISEDLIACWRDYIYNSININKCNIKPQKTLHDFYEFLHTINLTPPDYKVKFEQWDKYQKGISVFFNFDKFHIDFKVGVYVRLNNADYDDKIIEGIRIENYENTLNKF